jgi:hypothetical protein
MGRRDIQPGWKNLLLGLAFRTALFSHLRSTGKGVVPRVSFALYLADFHKLPDGFS